MKPAFKAPATLLVRTRQFQDGGFLPDAPEAAAELGEQLARERAAAALLARENRFIQRMLDDRDRQLSELHSEITDMRKDWIWRALCRLRKESRRLRRLFRARVQIASRPATVSDCQAARGAP